MKKASSIIMLLLAAFMFQYASAQNTEDVTETKLSGSNFINGFEFPTFGCEGEKGDDGQLWHQEIYDGNGYLVADAMDNIGDRKNIVSYCVLCSISLKTDNTIWLRHKGEGFNGNMSGSVSVVIKDYFGDEWVEIPGLKCDEDGKLIETGRLDIPKEFENTEVSIALKYTAESSKHCGKWSIDEYAVYGKTYGISYADTEVTYEIASGKPFAEPELSNPSNLYIRYYGDNDDVATVEQQSGEVEICGKGEVTITAKAGSDGSTQASYKIIVTDDLEIYSVRGFNDDLNGFVVENNDQNLDMWHCYNSWVYAHDGDDSGKTSDTYLVSPVIKLDSGGNTLSFVNFYRGFETPEEFKDAAGVYVRVPGGEWCRLDIKYQDYATFTFNSAYNDVPEEFNGKEVQFGFRFNNKYPEKDCKWQFKNLIIRKKISPEISWEKSEIVYVLNSTLPTNEFINPHDVECSFASSNTDVIHVDESNGWTNSLGTPGESVITATSKATNVFYSSTASYLFKVVDDSSTGIDNVEITDLSKAEIYDLQGRRLNHLQKGINIVNGKKIVVR